MSIDISAAAERAQAYLVSVIEREAGMSCALVLAKVREDAEGWYFPYQSEESLTTGDFNRSLVGNWPIFVSRDGTHVGPKRPSPPPST